MLSRGAMSTCQWKCSAPRGAVRTQRLSSGEPSKRFGEQAQGGVDHRRARRVLGEARRRRARDHAQLEGRARGPGADQRRLLVDRDQALLAPHLLDQDRR